VATVLLPAVARLNGDGLRREDVNVEIREGEVDAVDEGKFRGQGEEGFGAVLRHLQFVLDFDVEHAVFQREQMAGGLRAGGGGHELERARGKGDARQNGRLEQERERLAFDGLPVDFCGGERELVLDANSLRDG